MSTQHPVLLFDGVCNLCNGSVQFIIDRDPDAQFRFASLQSEAGRQLLEARGIKNDLDTVVLVDGEQVYERSDAALRVFRHLGGLWLLMLIFWPLPRVIRDWVYNFVATNRYRLFGKQEFCMIPTEDNRRRFLS